MSSPDLTLSEMAAVQRYSRQRISASDPNRSIRERLPVLRRCATCLRGVQWYGGLHLAVIAAGVAQGDLVLTTPFSFVASANCALYQRAVPIFVDVDPITGNIDPVLVAEAVRDLTGASGSSRDRWLPPSMKLRSQLNQDLKAVLSVHTFGQPADMDPIGQVAREHGLFVIEDACEAMAPNTTGAEQVPSGMSECSRSIRTNK